MMNMEQHHGQIRMTFKIPTRGLLGFRNEFIINTKGEGILSSRFINFEPTPEKSENGRLARWSPVKRARL